MIAVVMAGGRASRFRSRVEKALLRVGGSSLLTRAVEALQAKGVDEIVVAVSPHVPETRREAERIGLRVVETSGEGYHEDVMMLLETLDVFLTLNVDVPFVRGLHVERLLEDYEGGSVAAVIDKPSAGLELYEESTGRASEGGRFVWVGLNIVTSDQETRTVLLDEPLLAINVNDEDSLAKADSIAIERGI